MGKEVLQISADSNLRPADMAETPEWITVKEAVAIFGVPERTLRRYISQRKIRSRLENRERLVYANDIRPPKNKTNTRGNGKTVKKETKIKTEKSKKTRK